MLINSFHILATGKTLEEIDELFARSQEVRERLAHNVTEHSHTIAGDEDMPMGRRASAKSAIDTHLHSEKV
jgi:hypothetical protein